MALRASRQRLPSRTSTITAGRNRGVARQLHHPARRVLVGAEPERLAGDAFERRRSRAGRQSKSLAVGDDDERLVLHDQPLALGLGRLAALLGGLEGVADAIAIEREVD